MSNSINSDIVRRIGFILTSALVLVSAHWASPAAVAGSVNSPGGGDCGNRCVVKPQGGGAAYTALPLRFEVNQGQAPMDFRYLARGPGYSVSLRAAEAMLMLRRDDERPDGEGAPRAVKVGYAKPVPAHAEASTRLHIHLVGADPHAAGEAVDELPTRVNYVTGQDRSQWRMNIATFAKVKYENVYPGVDVVWYGNDRRQLEYDFVVAPGHDPDPITLAFDGANALAVDKRGDLVLRTAGGELRQQRPLIYQEVAGERKVIPGSYVLKGRREVGFAVGAYDPTRPLVIDPVLVYSTYFGGPGPGDSSPDKDVGNDIAVDADGNAYVTGATNSRGRWDTDAYVAKFDPSGTTLLYVTYLDQGKMDFGNGIAVDAAGYAYVTGSTADQGVFVARLDDAGSVLYFVMFGADSGFDFGTAIAADAEGNAYVTGVTHLAHAVEFPIAGDAFQPNRGGGRDAFVAKLDPQGAILYSTFLGGSGQEEAWGIKVHGDGNAYVTRGRLGRRTSLPR